MFHGRFVSWARVGVPLVVVLVLTGCGAQTQVVVDPESRPTVQAPSSSVAPSVDPSVVSTFPSGVTVIRGRGDAFVDCTEEEESRLCDSYWTAPPSGSPR